MTTKGKDIAQKGYYDRILETKDKLAHYEHDLNRILASSVKISHDLVQYVVKLLKEGNNDHEVGAVLVDLLQKKKYTRKATIKILVKLLFVVQSISAMKYRDFHTLKKYVDKSLDNEYVNKNYNKILKRLCQEVTRKQVNKYYGKSDPEENDYLRQNISFI